MVEKFKTIGKETPITLGLAIVLVGGIVGGASWGGVIQTKIDALQQDVEELKAQKDDINTKLTELQTLQARSEAKLDILLQKLP